MNPRDMPRPPSRYDTQQPTRAEVDAARAESIRLAREGAAPTSAVAPEPTTAPASKPAPKVVPHRIDREKVRRDQHAKAVAKVRAAEARIRALDGMGAAVDRAISGQPAAPGDAALIRAALEANPRSTPAKPTPAPKRS